MTDDHKKRTVPATALRSRYRTLSKRLDDSAVACKQLIGDPSPLAAEFVQAVRAWSDYDLRGEGFLNDHYERKALRSVGTGRVTDRLGLDQPVSVRGPVSYTFRYLAREISPRRTPSGHNVDGGAASDSGLGGIDYVGVVDDSNTPVLGEIKFEDDAEPAYAFVQLLTYLSELASPNQCTRANEFLFQHRVGFPTAWDLHILLADFNDRGQRGPFIGWTRDLVTSFRSALSSEPEAAILGRVLCLRMNVDSFDRVVDLVWEA